MNAEMASFLGSAGLPTLLAAAFGGGLLLSATPCVYPMIPVTVAAFGGQRTSRRRAAGLALLYVLGIAVTYATLGVWAAATGRLFGAALADPRVTGAFALLFALLAALSLGWLPGLEALLARTPRWALRASGASPGGALAMGLVAGVVFAPCVGPFVVGVLAHVATTGDLLTGGLLLGTVGLGMGAPFVALALVSGELARWPRAGALPQVARAVIGVALLGAALYYASLAVSGQVFLGLGALAGAALLGDGFRRAWRAGRIRLAAVSTLLLVSAGAVVWQSAPPAEPPAPLAWRSDLDAALADARSQGRFAVVDFTADWCLVCHELERVTFQAPPVRALLERVVRVRVDATRMTERVEALFERFRVLGLPAVLLIGPDGREVEPARIASFVPPEEALRRWRAGGLGSAEIAHPTRARGERLAARPEESSRP